MANPSLIVERLVTDKVLQASSAMTGRSPASHGLAVAAALFAVAGLGFMVFAAHLWLNRHYQPDLAAALTGLIALGVAFLIALLAAVIFYLRRSTVRKLQAQARKSVQEVFEVVDDFLADPVRDHPKTAALAATLAGFMIGGRHF